MQDAEDLVRQEEWCHRMKRNEITLYDAWLYGYKMYKGNKRKKHKPYFLKTINPLITGQEEVEFIQMEFTYFLKLWFNMLVKYRLLQYQNKELDEARDFQQIKP